MAQLKASQAVAAQLQLENEQTKTEIYKIVHEIMGTFTVAKNFSSQEWCRMLSSGMEIQMLQSHYNELWNVHLNSNHEITADLYEETLRRHGSLCRLYKQSLKSYVALEDDLERLTRQLTNPLTVRAPGPLAIAEDLMTIVV